MNKIDGDLCHLRLTEQIKPILSYNENRDYFAWKSEVKAKLSYLLGDMPQKTPINVNKEYERQARGYKEIRFTYESEKNCLVPAHLLIPDAVKNPPVVICLQGHSTGMHISLGVAKYPNDENSFPRAAHGLNAVKNGYAALVIEQRGMGERKSTRTGNDHFATFTALLLGRTIIGERVWDVSRGIDALETFGGLDLNHIVCLGNSGGGTAAYYAAAMDERIFLAVPSCSVSSYRDSIGAIHHCPCNYLPGALKWFDMGEIACLIAPRKLLVVAGKKDEIFPIDGVRKVYSVIESVYKKENAEKNVRLIETEKDHWFCEDLIWPAVNKIIKG